MMIPAPEHAQDVVERNAPRRRPGHGSDYCTYVYIDDYWVLNDPCTDEGEACYNPNQFVPNPRAPDAHDADAPATAGIQVKITLKHGVWQHRRIGVVRVEFERDGLPDAYEFPVSRYSANDDLNEMGQRFRGEVVMYKEVTAVPEVTISRYGFAVEGVLFSHTNERPKPRALHPTPPMPVRTAFARGPAPVMFECQQVHHERPG